MKASWSFGLFASGIFIALGNWSPAPEATAKIDDPDVAFMRLIRIEEKRSALSYRNSSGSLANSNKHILALTFKTLGDLSFRKSSRLSS